MELQARSRQGFALGRFDPFKLTDLRTVPELRTMHGLISDIDLTGLYFSVCGVSKTGTFWTARVGENMEPYSDS